MLIKTTVILANTKTCGTMYRCKNGAIECITEVTVTIPDQPAGEPQVELAIINPNTTVGEACRIALNHYHGTAVYSRMSDRIVEKMEEWL